MTDWEKRVDQQNLLEDGNRWRSLITHLANISTPVVGATGFESVINHIDAVREDAARWRKLVSIVGSQRRMTLTQGSKCHVEIEDPFTDSRECYVSGSFEAAIDSIKD